MYIFIIILIGYLLGCVNGSEIIGKVKQQNIKNKGMKNAGATNTTLILGFRYGVIVAMIDIAKAMISLYITALILQKLQVLPDVQIVILYLNAFFVIMGHNYPLQMNFKGGKGTASFFGILLYFDWKYAILSLFILLIFAILMNYFVLGTLMTYVSFMMYSIYTFGRGTMIITVMLLIVFLVKHVENFKRMIQKEEVTLSSLYRREAN